MKSSTILFLIILFCLIGLTGYLTYDYKQKQEKAKEESKIEKISAIPVHVAKIETGSIDDVVYLNGNIEPSDRADVLAKIMYPGKLIKAKVREGDKVKKGQVIALVDRDEVGAVYVPYSVESPLSGVVASIVSDEGALITNQSPIATIINTDKVKISASLIEADLGRVKEGITALISMDAYPDREFKGTLTRINPTLDVFSHTAKIEITVQNSDGALRPGMFATVKLLADRHSNVPVISKNVVMKREGKDLAFIYHEEDKRVHLTAIKLGYYDREMYEVLDGAKTGDLLVDKDLVILKDRTLVTISNTEPETIESEKPAAENK